MQSRATQAYAQAIESASFSVAQATKRLNTIKANRKMIGKVLRSLDKMLDNKDRMYLMENDNMPHVYVVMYDLDSFKDERLMKVLGYLSETMDNMNTQDWAQSVNRDYRFKSATYSGAISAYVREDSPTCRKVLVGTELQTVEKYEIVCD
jgi:hypothetical protein